MLFERNIQKTDCLMNRRTDGQMDTVYFIDGWTYKRMDGRADGEMPRQTDR